MTRQSNHAACTARSLDKNKQPAVVVDEQQAVDEANVGDLQIHHDYWPHDIPPFGTDEFDSEDGCVQSGGVAIALDDNKPITRASSSDEMPRAKRHTTSTTKICRSNQGRSSTPMVPWSFASFTSRGDSSRRKSIRESISDAIVSVGDSNEKDGSEDEARRQALFAFLTPLYMPPAVEQGAEARDCADSNASSKITDARVTAH